MGERLIKPYEISVWEDKLTPNGFIEKKLAVIGSDTMTGLNKVYDPVFNKKTNGEKTLSFSLRYKYFDPYSGNSDYVNPFAALLINERKVKLHYDNQWYEFIVKDHTESSDGLEWTYTCSDAFVLELSKNGYNITFDSELNNNQGTAHELAEKTLKDTDWKLGGVTVGRQLVAEPIYEATLVSTSDITVVNTDNTGETVAANTAIYLFYTYVKNQDGKFVQFIVRDGNYLLDDNNVITKTNYRITTELIYQPDGFYKGGTKIISWDNIESQYQANRLVYGQLTTYDPVMKRTVDKFKASNGDLEVYRYTDYTYTTSNVITNFITNGDNFNKLEDGSLQGWNPYVDFTGRESGGKIDSLELVTRPELATGVALADLSTLSQIEGFLRVAFKRGLITHQTNYYKNAIYNSGITNSASFINSISNGDEFVFRWRAAKRNPEVTDPDISDVDCLVSTNELGLIVAKYVQDKPGQGYYYKYFKQSDIILQTTGTPQEFNNYISGGTLQTIDGKQSYVIDDIPQTPSTKYIYKVGNTEYIWDPPTGNFVLKTNNNYLPYYYLKATATRAVTSSILKDPTEKIGIFIYSTDTSADEKVYYIQDIQLTRFVADANGQPLLIGNVPTATSAPTEYYYVKPVEGTEAEDVVTYASVDELKSDLGLGQSVTIDPIYNTNSEKNLTITASQSNCFNILQTIAETFECWIDLVVEHDVNGAIQIIDGVPQKYVYLKEYAGKDNYAGFKYGINLNSIERTVNSDEIVTKLIVDQSQSDYVDEGFVSIANASSNISGESYILNFDYYYNQGLLDREDVEADKNTFISNTAQINKQLRAKEKQRRELQNSLTALESKRNVFTELVDTAEDNLTRALADFERLTGQSYDDYRRTHDGLDDDEQLTEEETVFDTLGEIYASSATINNYSGLLTNIEQEYWEVREKLRGTENYSVKIWVGQDDNRQDHIFVELDDYLIGFRFTVYGQDYIVSVSQKYFDILINTGSADGQVITFTAPAGYTITPNTYTVNKNKTQTFRIIANGSSPGIEDDIDDLQEQKDNLTREFNNKYRRFIQEGTWSSTDYIDSEHYYLDALQVSNTSAQPTVSYTINVVEISELEGFKWYLFDAGDKTYIEDTEFFGWANVNGHLTPAREEVIVAEVEWHLEEPENNVITVQNYKTRFEDLFQRISAAVQTVQYNEATYAKISSLLDSNGTINQDVLLESLNRISGQRYNLTSDGSVVINGDQILVRNLTNPANCVIINSEGIRISSDGGQTWRTAIDGQGINIGTVYTGTLNTQNVVIGSSENPSFRWDKSGISAYKLNEEIGIYDLKTYVRYDEFGLYGIKNNGAFKAKSLEDVLDKAHFAVTWDGFFIRNNYTNGRVEITSDNDFQVIQTINGTDHPRIKIGALEFDNSGNPIKYGININQTVYNSLTDQYEDIPAFTTGSDGNITITGIINATGGNFSGLVNIGQENQDHIIINGNSASIQTSNYQDGAGYGWIINKDGDAVFNNITARGAIKTAVFEYAEIQAVGGIFIFRPSSTIRNAELVSGTDDIRLTLEKPYLFKVGDWCKISNYTDGQNEPIATAILSNNGLTHVYKIKSIDANNSRIVILENAYTSLTSGNIKVINNVTDLIGGALIDMGNNVNGNGVVGTSNYGIGVNSSDNTVNLPARAISLFETVINTTQNPKVSYNYRAILGTLPTMQYTGINPQVNSLYHNFLEGTQGIYTNNMYIGDSHQYIAFYTDNNNNKQLKIKANQIVYEIDDQTGEEITWDEHFDEQVPVRVDITSNIGNEFINTGEAAVLTCTVYRGVTDITNQITRFVWTKKLSDGSLDITWNTAHENINSNIITILPSDISVKAIFECNVTF